MPLIARAVTLKETSHHPQSSDLYGYALMARGSMSAPDTSGLDLSLIAAASYESTAVFAYNGPTSSKKAPVERVDHVLARIAECESQGNLEARNPKSTAKGKYQFLDGSWKYYGEKLWGSLHGKSVFSEKDQDDLARYVVSINGYKDWEASKHCWLSTSNGG